MFNIDVYGVCFGVYFGEEGVIMIVGIGLCGILLKGGK